MFGYTGIEWHWKNFADNSISSGDAHSKGKVGYRMFSRSDIEYLSMDPLTIDIRNIPYFCRASMPLSSPGRVLITTWEGTAYRRKQGQDCYPRFMACWNGRTLEGLQEKRGMVNSSHGNGVYGTDFSRSFYCCLLSGLRTSTNTSEVGSHDLQANIYITNEMMQISKPTTLASELAP